MSMTTRLICFTAGVLPVLACTSQETEPRPVLADQSLATTVRFQAVSVVDARTIWISGVQGAVVRSVDGGAHWEWLIVPDADSLQFRDVHALSASVAYLLSAGQGAMSRIYRTTDGGISWDLQFTNPIPDAFYDCFAFWDATSGIAFSDAVDGSFVIVRTTDGRTWHRIPPDDLPPAEAGEGGFAASGTCATTLGDSTAWIGTGNTTLPRVLVSHDRGRTWQSFTTPIVSGEASGITSVAAWTADTVTAVGGAIGRSVLAADRVARSTDGGKTWLRGGTPPYPGAVYGAAYIPRSVPPTLVAVGPGGAAASLDHGASWTLLDTAAYWGLGFSSPEVGWLVGPDGRVIRLSWSAARSR